MMLLQLVENLRFVMAVNGNVGVTCDCLSERGQAAVLTGRKFVSICEMSGRITVLMS